MQKKIAYLLKGREKQITREETVLQPLPHKDFRFANPFIVIHHRTPNQIAPGSDFRIHPHPHRGFAPVTFMLQGEGYHKDNAGHDETVYAGDVQWMFAGRGLLHSEGPTKALLSRGGVQEFIQIWVNVPKAHKWDEPTYQSARKEIQPQVLEQDGVNLRLATGEYESKKGPIDTLTPVISIWGTIAEGAKVQFSARPGYWTLLYIASGKACINQESVEEHTLVVFEKDNDEILVSGETDLTVLYLSAEPIDEPVAAKDNFVMNTAEEVEQALQDYQDGVFGTLSY